MEDRKGRFQSVFYEWGEALVIALTVVVLLFSFVMRINGIIGSSMLPTLHGGDKVLLLGNLFYRTPARGDVVILRKGDFYGGEPIVKRVIATEGDTLEIDFEAHTVKVNGDTLDEPYINEPTERPIDMDYPRAGPVTVPEGCMFVMGDNRNASSDSRDAGLGMVDTRYIIGKVLWRALPLSSFGAIS